MRLAFAAVALCVLAGCGPSRAWTDASGQNRGFDEMRADEIACIKEVDEWQDATGIKLYAVGVVNRRTLCMAQKGWRLSS